MDVLGDYTIIKELGQVLLAEHRYLKKLFILKLFPTKIVKERLEKIAPILTGLQHPSIAKIYNISSADGRYFAVMDPYLDSLQQPMNLDRYKKNLSEEEVESIITQIASALDYIHQVSVGAGKYLIHGRIKLTNIFLEQQEGGPLRVFLTDFGLIDLMEPDRILSKNSYFLSPEQKIGLEGIDAKSDTYALGVLTYYLLTKEFPDGCFYPPSHFLPDRSRNWDLFLYKTLMNFSVVKQHLLQIWPNASMRLPQSKEQP